MAFAPLVVGCRTRRRGNQNFRSEYEGSIFTRRVWWRVCLCVCVCVVFRMTAFAFTSHEIVPLIEHLCIYFLCAARTSSCFSTSTENCTLRRYGHACSHMPLAYARILRFEVLNWEFNAVAMLGIPTMLFA